jgi:hypothetical protein
MQHPFPTSIDPVLAGDVLGRLLLSPLGVLGVLCLGFGVQAGLRLVMGVGRPVPKRARPTTWTRF